MPEKEKLYTPEMLGFKRCTEADLDGGETPEEAARIFDAVLGNRATEAQKSCVIANSAFAIQVICPEKKIETCIARHVNHWKAEKHWLHSVNLYL